MNYIDSFTAFESISNGFRRILPGNIVRVRASLFNVVFVGLQKQSQRRSVVRVVGSCDTDPTMCIIPASRVENILITTVSEEQQRLCSELQERWKSEHAIGKQTRASVQSCARSNGRNTRSGDCKANPKSNTTHNNSSSGSSSSKGTTKVLSTKIGDSEQNACRSKNRKKSSSKVKRCDGKQPLSLDCHSKERTSPVSDSPPSRKLRSSAVSKDAKKFERRTRKRKRPKGKSTQKAPGM